MSRLTEEAKYRMNLANLYLIDTFGFGIDIYVPRKDAVRLFKALQVVGFRWIEPEDVFYKIENLEKAEAEGFDYKAILKDHPLKDDDRCLYRIYERKPIIKPFDRENPTPLDIYLEDFE